jgi:hypothetical protein
MRPVRYSCRWQLRLVAAAVAFAATAAQVASVEACDSHSTPAATARATTARRRVIAHAPRVKRAASPRAVASTPRVAMSGPRLAGLVAIVDPATGRVVAATPEQLRDLSAGSSNAAAAATLARPADPEVIQRADGTLQSTLPARFMMFAFAHLGTRGRVDFDCANDPAKPVAAAPTPARAAPNDAPWEVK